MNANFWHDKWKTNRIGWHLDEVNPIIVKHIGSLQLQKNARIFLPLCGKTKDIDWLLSQGFRIAGAELSLKAIQELFQELHVEPEVSTCREFTVYSAQNIDIFVGNIFDLDSELLGNVDAVYDRAAVVAMRKEMRPKYVKHIIDITKQKPQILINLQYNQKLMDGPPFCVMDEEIKSLYEGNYKLKQLESLHVDKLAGKCEAKENIWLLN